MKVDPSNRLSEALVAGLDPLRLQQYLRATGWKLEPRLGKGHSAVFERPESRLVQVRVPLTRDLTDYATLMSDAVAVIATWEQRPARDVLDELLFPPSDLLRFSESGPASAAGNLPFDHGLALLAGARKALLAVACSVIRPQRFYPCLSLAEAEQFLRHCRLGQTERGSFTMTVACPLDALPPSEPLFDQTPFARQATALLMRSLQQLALFVELDDWKSVLEPAEGQPMISANLCEGLLDMTPEGEGSALTVSVNWSRTLPPPNDTVLPHSIRLHHENFARIEMLAGRLRPPRTPQRQGLLGFVDTLDGRPNAEGRREGPVTLQVATPEGEVLRVRADLDADSYHTAWLAHGQNLPVTLRGILRRGGRIHRVDEISEFRIYQETASPVEEPAAVPGGR